MRALYTEYYYQYLEHGNIHPQELDLFPQIKISDLVSLSMSDLARERWFYLEIGSETEELFTHNLKKVIHESLVLYVDKIKLYNDNITSLMSRIVAESEVHTENGGTTYNDQNNYYLNPTDEQTENLVVQNVNKSNESATVINRKETQRNKSFGFFKTNPEILAEVNKLKIVYMEALQYMDKAFMEIY